MPLAQSSLSRPPLNVSRELIREKCSDFSAFQIWPLRARMDPRAWLANFSDADQVLAHHLLNAFVFFSPELTAQLFTSALQSISTLTPWRQRRTGDVFSEWRSFLRRATITHVTGEIPRPSDSGTLFTRLARDRAGIPEDQIISPEEALTRCVTKGDDSSLIFVDDFMGSGEQFLKTWTRSHAVAGERWSFARLAQARNDAKSDFEVYFVTAISNSGGVNALKKECPNVVVSSGNILDEKCSLFHPDSVIWPKELAAQGRTLIERVSERLGLPDDGDKWDYRGFRMQGLALGFDHKVPDATIPLFRLSRPDWSPLVRAA